MSSLEDRMYAKHEAEMSPRTVAAMKSIHAKQRKAAAVSYAWIGGPMTYGEAAMGNGTFGKLSRAAKWFCLWFAMIAPVLLFWSVIF